jgi:hypothetical protein
MGASNEEPQRQWFDQLARSFEELAQAAADPVMDESAVRALRAYHVIKRCGRVPLILYSSGHWSVRDFLNAKVDAERQTQLKAWLTRRRAILRAGRSLLHLNQIWGVTESNRRPAD